ncbi:MAG TPA: hypothetical protein VFE24_18260 [Pirellulales bacterium]|jgi:hypothetical protein|nr:hypothetical protein [Pirellulales bacterium]
MKQTWLRNALMLALAAMILATGAAMASACPSCREALAAGDPQQANLVRGFYWSILFMLLTPFTLLGTFGTYMYLLVKRERVAREAKSAAAAAMHAAVPERDAADAATEPAAAAEAPQRVEVG